MSTNESDKQFVDVRYAKSKEYRQVLDRILAEGKCPFCPDNFTHHTQPILNRVGTWLITRAAFPYENVLEHFLLIGEAHKEHISELTHDDMEAVRQLVVWATREFGLKGGGVAFRFGDTQYTGATVCHLHVHFIVPATPKHVNFPIG